MASDRQIIGASACNQASGAAMPASSFDLTLAETKYFWSWFIFGSIMTVETRHHLWRSWGFCSRHTWLHAAVECEIWGGRPFGTAILYEDLVSRAAAAARAPLLPGGVLRRRLRAKASCLACDYVTVARDFKDEAYAERCARVNRRSRISALILQAEPLWRGNACSLCLKGRGMVCRSHILAGAAKSDSELSGKLEDLRRRLALYVRSLTWKGPKADAPAKVSWVDALGWFAGWDFPLAIAAEAGARSARRG